MRKKTIVKFKETKKEKKWIITRGERRQETSSGRQWREWFFFFSFPGQSVPGQFPDRVLLPMQAGKVL